MLSKILVYIISAACLVVLSYWIYLYITDAPKVVSVEHGVISSHRGESTFVALENGAIIETPYYESPQGSKVLVVVKSGRRTGSVSYFISKPAKILIAVDADSFDKNRN